MAILLSAQSLGSRNIPQPRQGVVSVDNGRAMGAAVQDVSQTIGKLGSTIQEKQDKLELARAKSYWLKEQVQANSDAEQDQDYATLQDRYGQRLVDAKKNALGMLSNPETRAMFDTDLEGDFTRGMAGVKSLTYKRTVDDGRAKFSQTTDDNLQAMAQAPDEATRTSLTKTQSELIKATQDRGFLTAEEAQKKRQDFVQDSVVQRAQAMMVDDPKGTYQLLKPSGVKRSVSEVSQTTASKYKGVSPSYLTTTAAIETGGTFDPQSINKNSGAAGLYQITPGTARALKIKDPHDPVESADGTARLAVANTPILKKATGHAPTDAEIYLAHQQGGPQAAALLKSPDENVVDVLAKVYGSAGKARAAVIQNGGDSSMTASAFSGMWTNKYADFEKKYAGSAVKTDGVQVASLDGGSGQVVPNDATGQIPHFEKTGTWIDMIPMDKRLALLSQAESQVRQDRVINRQLLDSKVKDSTSMAKEGFPDDSPPSLADFEDAYEPKEAELRYREYAQTQKVATTIHDAATMTPGEQAATLIKLKPQPGAGSGSGFDTEQSNYETLQTAIAAANTARKADPIAFAQKYKLDPSAQPLDVKDPEALAKQLGERGSLGTTMNQEYGVPLRVFTEPEAQTITTSLNGLTANQRLGWLTSINKGLQDNPNAYTAAMGQLRPGSPVTAYAGTYLGLNGSVTDDKNNPVTPQSVAAGILQGEDLINPPKDSEGKETKPALKMPSADGGGMFNPGMRKDFNATWGTAMQGQPQAANDTFEAARSYYAYLSAQAGSYDGQYDSDRFGKAMQAVMGNSEPVEIGESSVIAPWGMPADKFKDAAKVAFDRVATEQKLRSDTWNFDDATFLGTGRPGEYTVQVGTMNMVDKRGYPLVVKVNERDAEIDPALGVPKSILDQYYPGKF